MKVDLSVLNLTTLGKGSTVLARDIEKATGVSRRDFHNYRIAAMNLWKALDAHFRKDDVILSFGMKKDDLLIFTDSQATVHEHRKAKGCRRRIRRCYERLCAVDTGNLSFQEQEQHQRRVVIEGAYLGALKKARAAIPIQNVSEQVR
jgi:hypothetical protein